MRRIIGAPLSVPAPRWRFGLVLAGGRRAARLRRRHPPGRLSSSNTSRPRPSCAAGRAGRPGVEGTAVVRMQFGHGADREAGGGNARPGPGDDLVAHHQTGAQRHVAQFQAVAGRPRQSGARHCAPRSPARRVVGVGQQQHGRMRGGGGDHLAHQAAGIDHRLAHARRHRCRHPARRWRVDPGRYPGPAPTARPGRRSAASAARATGRCRGRRSAGASAARWRPAGAAQLPVLGVTSWAWGGGVVLDPAGRYAPASPPATRSACTITLARARTCDNQPPRMSSTINTTASSEVGQQPQGAGGIAGAGGELGVRA